MRFGPVPVAGALGATLAHSMTGSSGKIAKGTVLEAGHIDALRAAGLDMITVAQLDPGDVEENAAATALAQALVPDPEAQGLRIAAAGAGRVNLYATGPGVLQMDTNAVHALNAVDPMITIATVPAFHRVEERTMIATIKIIAYGVPGAALADACAAGQGALRIAAPVYGLATLIETVVAGDVPSDKGRAALTGRLDRMGLTLSPRVAVDHIIDPLAQALKEAPGEVIFVLTASATSDPRDVGPEALRAAGGTVTAYGMPVDPGNLLFCGWLGDKPVIGLPGCARSPALNGADWVMERIICGQRLTQASISAMGVGGLLKEIPTRPRPRAS
ncbi:molybdopterin-binding protein [uncultured Tateyamaria sp.]|uniref:molybdopterin-binding protein n=1 Tax=Tateyamaria sp. TaxID=1929288 RepID=UPI0026254860|nr:molybdopterin-binding protein [uncultured Tateyamaria sp.]